jgi:hypothetical protein
MDTNDDNHNSNRPIDKPPPQKKQKTNYPRTYNDYATFAQIITKLGSLHDASLFTCLRYVNEKGILCDDCCADKKLKGPFTEQQPVTNFNYTKIKRHIWTPKHYKRIKDDIKKLHPLYTSM